MLLLFFFPLFDCTTERPVAGAVLLTAHDNH